MSNPFIPYCLFELKLILKPQISLPKIIIPKACQYLIEETPKRSGTNQFQSPITIRGIKAKIKTNQTNTIQPAFIIFYFLRLIVAIKQIPNNRIIEIENISKLVSICII